MKTVAFTLQVQEDITEKTSAHMHSKFLHILYKWPILLLLILFNVVTNVVGRQRP